jgi:hypothetical protein
MPMVESPTDSPGVQAQFVKGESWTDPGFISSSVDYRIAEEFAFDAAVDGRAPVLIQMEGLSGSRIDSISRYPREAEVLFQRGLEYEVIAKFIDDDGLWHITLRETAP